MSFPVATGATVPPIYPTGGTGNAFQANGFIPEIWSGKLVEKFYSSTVLAAIANTNYEGEIKNAGDRVRIRTKATVTIKDYFADSALELERPEGSDMTLFIDMGKYFNTILDDVMEVQSDLNALSDWSDDVSQQLKVKIDKDVLRSILNNVSPANAGATAGAITSSINLGATTAPLATVSRNPTGGQVEILDVILRLGQALDEQNIPEEGRWLILPVWAIAQLKFSDLRQAYLTGDSITPMRNGRIGMVDRFMIYSSNLLPMGVAGDLAASEYAIFAGHSHGLTFASQVSKMETMRSEVTFGTILRGLQVYGSKVIDGTAIAQAICAKA